MKQVVVQIAWYRREEWEKLRSLSADGDKLEKTYDEWLKLAEKTVGQLKGQGVTANKVDVAIDELAQWCQQHGRKLDAAADKPSPPGC
jgi:hypothetical protein